MKKIRIEKKYHFYYGHRNEKLNDNKCSRPHGHVARFKINLLVQKNEQTQTGILFNDIDSLVKPVLKFYDHYFIVNKNDLELKEAFEKFDVRLVDWTTSAENVALHIFNTIQSEIEKQRLQCELISISFMETESSTVIIEK